jgi:hypothetical protein
VLYSFKQVLVNSGARNGAALCDDCRRFGVCLVSSCDRGCWAKLVILVAVDQLVVLKSICSDGFSEGPIGDERSDAQRDEVEYSVQHRTTSSGWEARASPLLSLLSNEDKPGFSPFPGPLCQILWALPFAGCLPGVE